MNPAWQLKKRPTKQTYQYQPMFDVALTSPWKVPEKSRRTPEKFGTNSRRYFDGRTKDKEWTNRQTSTSPWSATTTSRDLPKHRRGSTAPARRGETSPTVTSTTKGCVRAWINRNYNLKTCAYSRCFRSFQHLGYLITFDAIIANLYQL